MKDLLSKNECIIDSRMIADLSGKEHRHVMRDIRDECEKLQNEGLSTESIFGLSEYKDSTGRKLPMYTMTKKGAMQLALRYDAATRYKVIDYVEKLESPNKLPTSYKEALQQLLAKVEENESLLLENREMKPKAEFFDAVADSKDAIEVGTVAKVLGIRGLGRNNLFELLRQKGILMNNNQPYQSYVDRGWFRIVEQHYTKPDGTNCINIKTLVYQKGVEGIRDVVNKNIDQLTKN